LGASAQYWMNLESRYQLRQTCDEGTAISRRARLYQLAPIREMVKRGWLESSQSIDALEARVQEFFQISNLDQPVGFAHAARKGRESLSPAHFAWLHRARQLARDMNARPFSERSFQSGLYDLKGLLPRSQDTRLAPNALAAAGIRFLVIEHLPKTRIDGATFWLDDVSPVIVLSLRYDRVDWFWFTIAHELGHIHRRDGLWETAAIVDTDLVGVGASKVQESDVEKAANQFATEFLVEQSALDRFIAETGPMYSATKITAFADSIGVHPGIVLGQLQHRGEVGWACHRQMLDKVRNIVIQSVLADGWGHRPH